MILTLRYPKLNKLNNSPLTASTKLANGEQYLIQTVDKKLALTTHRLIKRQFSWFQLGHNSVMLEDIDGWEVKTTGNSLYFGLSLAMALMVYFNDAFALLAGFFLMLFLMTRQRRIHVKTTDKVMVLPFDVEEKRVSSLVEMVRKAKQARLQQLGRQAA